MNAKLGSLKALLLIALLTAGVIAGFVTRDHWKPWLTEQNANASSDTAPETSETTAPTTKIILSDQAIANLSLKAKPITPDTFWRTIPVPGMIVDRPGKSDRSVASPTAGTVSEIHRLPGDMVKSGDVILSVRLLSESVLQTQSDLFKAEQDISLAQAELKRLEQVLSSIPEIRVRELNNRITRSRASVLAHRSELANRGLTSIQIDEAATGKFALEITVTVPNQNVSSTRGTQSPSPQAIVYELQELKVDLGQQVQMGQAVCLLANHRELSIEGQAFRDEAPLLERCVREGWPLEVDFQEGSSTDWLPLKQEFHIDQISNSIDPVNRTFRFRMRLQNESRIVNRDGKTYSLWRFRPGHRVRLKVRVEKFPNVFILSSDALVRDGAEAFVFTQNVNTFERRPVTVVFQDRQNAILSTDKSLIPGSFVVQNAAAQLNRMIKSQSNSVPKGYHVHADGSLHKNEDEGK